MSEDRRTKPELLVELTHAQAATDAAQQAREDAKKAHLDDRARRDAEAVAIEACSRALRKIEPADRSVNVGYASSSYSRSDSDQRISDSPSVGRVLGYLRQRFGLPDPAAQVDSLHAQLREAITRAESAEQQLDYIRSTVGGTR